MELRKDFVSEGIGLQLSGTRLNLLTTEQRDRKCVQKKVTAYWSCTNSNTPIISWFRTSITETRFIFEIYKLTSNLTSAVNS